MPFASIFQSLLTNDSDEKHHYLRRCIATGAKYNNWRYSLLYTVTGDIKAHQVLLNRVREQATEDSVKYQIYY